MKICNFAPLTSSLKQSSNIKLYWLRLVFLLGMFDIPSNAPRLLSKKGVYKALRCLTVQWLHLALTWRYYFRAAHAVAPPAAISKWGSAHTGEGSKPSITLRITRILCVFTWDYQFLWKVSCFWMFVAPFYRKFVQCHALFLLFEVLEVW